MPATDYMQSKIAKLYKSLIVLNFIGLLLTLLFNDTIVCDELEHLRASWFVSLGEMPYRDFFEHHHPLLWFMFAPVIHWLPQQIISTLYVAKCLAFLFSLGSSCFLFLIVKRFLGGVFSAILCLSFYFVYFTTWYSFSIFKPDTFMRFFYLLGLYQFFIFCDTKQTKYLVWCGISFTISFLFLQNIFFSILPLILPLGYLCFKDKKVCFDALKAAVIPLLILTACGGWMYINGTLPTYWQLNVIYNSHLFSVVHSFTQRILLTYAPELIFACLLLGVIYYKRLSSFYFNIIVLLFVAETVQRIVFPAVYPHYLILLFVFASMIIAYSLTLLQNKKLLFLSAFVLFVNLLFNFAIIGITSNSMTHKYLKEFDTHPNGSIVNFDGTLLNVYAPKYGYYWFYPNLEYVDNVLFERMPDYDINQLIQQKQPDYIAFKKGVNPHFYWDKSLTYKASAYWPHHKLDESILNDYEQILPDLYKRKNR